MRVTITANITFGYTKVIQKLYLSYTKLEVIYRYLIHTYATNHTPLISPNAGGMSLCYKDVRRRVAEACRNDKALGRD